MKIIGIGVDLVECARLDAAIARHGARFLERVFTAEERQYCGSLRNPSPCYAARFAAKEAVSKALGIGIGEHLGWLDMSVQRDGNGKPSIHLLGAGATFAA